MKVTVCFGPVKIVVPCGDGQITVHELINKSVARYKKATGKGESYWIHVRSLGSQGEGGILDADDLVRDVADDREKLTAIYEEQDEPGCTTNKYIGGDGTSTCNSSVGTSSPIMLDSNHINNSNNKYHMNHSPYHHEDGDDSDDAVVVTGQEISAESKLHVRRGSDPSVMPHMNENGTVIDTNANTLPVQQKSGPFVRNSKLRSSREELEDDAPFQRNSVLRSSRDELSSSAFERFGRDSSRRSLASNNALKWAEAQQKLENQENEMESSEIEIPNDGTPLGIHIIARVENDDGSAYGLVVHGIEDGGRAARDGRLRPGDHIKTINGINIIQETFDRAQEIMREAMKTPTVTVEIEREKVPPLVLPDSPHSNGPLDKTPPTPPPKSMPVVPLRSPTTALSANGPASPPVAEKTNLIAPTNTRRIGRKLYIQLMKGPQGLGFSITTRDNPTLGKNPIYIKNILPKGAAIADGRLKQGDRLLEVNGIEMTGKNQTEAVSILRSVKLGGVVNLIVSRQETPTKEMPRQLKQIENPTDDPTMAKNKQILTFNIGLNDTGSAGLGVSVKGKTSGGIDQETKDLGIFIKSVIHGGAASKDGRLRPNDQLLCINDTSLLNMSNSEAMETLRHAMSGEKSPRAGIQLIIARRFDNEVNTPTMSRASRSSLSSPSSVEITGDMQYHDMEWDRVSIKTPDVEAQLEQADELLNHPLLNSFNTNSLIEGRTTQLDSSMSSSQSPPVLDSEEERMKSPTLPTGGTETVMIEETDIDGVQPQGKSGMSSPRAPSPPNWLLSEWERAQDGEMSPLPDPEKEFSRENRARLSFSERRQGGSLDAKQMAWYKKTKEKLEEKEGEKQPGTQDVAASTGSLVKSTSSENLAMNTNLSSIKDLTEEERREIGPGLGLKKSSSLESLQAAVQEVTTTEEFPGRPRPKVVRGRGCNESFRAAVDRSYDMPMNGDAPTSEETGMTSNGPNGLPLALASDHSSVSSMEPGMNRTNSKRKSKDKRKSGGVFKGLGSMFRFGKNRKDNGGISPTEEDIRSHEVITTERLGHDTLDKYRNHEDQPKMRSQPDMHRLRDSDEPQRRSSDSLSKSERMQQLREKYQQHHRERQGRYIDDDIDDDDELEGREVDRYGHNRPSPSPKMPREQRGSPHSHVSLPDTSRGYHYDDERRRDHRDPDPRQDRSRQVPDKPMSNGYRHERDRHEHERTRESDPHINKNKSEDDDEGGFADRDGSRFTPRDDGHVDRRKDVRKERRDDDRDEKYRSHDGRQSDHRYDDRLYEERYRQANHGDRHDRHRDDRGRDPRYRHDPYHDRGDRTYERWNGRPEDRREDRRRDRREDKSREYLDQRDDRREYSRDRLDHVDKAESFDKNEKEHSKDNEKSEKEKDDEKQLKRRESERSLKSSKFSRRASDRSKKNKDKDKGKGANKTEEPPIEKIDRKEERRRSKKGNKKDDKKEKEQPKIKDKVEDRKEDDNRRDEFRNERQDDRRDDRKDDRHRRRDDPRDRQFDSRGEHRHRPDDGRYDTRDPRYNRDRRGPPPPDRHGYQSLERSHHRRPRQEPPPNKYYNTAPRDFNDAERPGERHHPPRRMGGGGDAQYPNHYQNDKSPRPYANGPSTSHPRQHEFEKPRRGGYDDSDYYGNSGYGSLHRHRRDERDFYDREHSHYDATARV